MHEHDETEQALVKKKLRHLADNQNMNEPQIIKTEDAATDWKALKPLGKTSWFSELWAYRELFFFMIWRNIKIKYKQSVLGIGWAILQPVCTMLIFTLFFGRLAKLPSEGAPYPIFFYSALLPWTFFASALSGTGNSLVANTNLITKVYFPRIIIPASSVLSGLLDLAVASSVLFVMMWYYSVPVSMELLAWPLLMVPLVLLALGVGMTLAALNVRYRDVKYTLPFIIQAWMFLSPVIYPTSMVPEKYRVLMFLNPTGGIIDAFRASVLDTRTINWGGFGISTAVTLIIFSIGLWYFRKTEREFADII